MLQLQKRQISCNKKAIQTVICLNSFFLVKNIFIMVKKRIAFWGLGNMGEPMVLFQSWLALKKKLYKKE